MATQVVALVTIVRAQLVGVVYGRIIIVAEKPTKSFFKYLECWSEEWKGTLAVDGSWSHWRRRVLHAQHRLRALLRPDAWRQWQDRLSARQQLRRKGHLRKGWRLPLIRDLRPSCDICSGVSLFTLACYSYDAFMESPRFKHGWSTGWAPG